MITIGLRADFEAVPELAGLGYDYLELPLTRIAALTDAQFEELLAYAGSIGLKAEVLWDMLPDSVRVCGADVRARVQHDYLDRAFGRAIRLGAKILVFDAPRARSVPSGFDFAMARRQTGNFLRMLQGHAAGTGLKIAIQSFRHAECNLINTVSEASLVTALLQLDQIGVLGDTVQMAYTSEPLSALTRCGSELLHVHTGCALSRGLPAFRDGEDYAKLFATLARQGYDGRVTAVSAVPYAPVRAAEALDCLRSAYRSALS